MENPPILIGTVNHLFLWAIEKPWRTVSHNQVGYPHFAMVNSNGPSKIRTRTPHTPDTRARRTAVAAASGFTELSSLNYIDLEPSHPKPTGDIVKILDTSNLIDLISGDLRIFPRH